MNSLEELRERATRQLDGGHSAQSDAFTALHVMRDLIDALIKERAAFDPTPRTVGTHQRCDDSYFRVWETPHGLYWQNMEWVEGQLEDAGACKGSYATVEEAADAGWANGEI